ncbi:Golgi SNAP receptor complex member 2-like [Tropilaelaps mercedesae]|uniref:Golgi SNAP receptor complex member 2-like n=1 Tax=Tropilaelaps mercedesae TaxID=418985 RepID=A0A1V9XI74_9ACAR|nr:Golgi SNAP receptor complex member 2-like [Tropilaelaps mercedesae]
MEELYHRTRYEMEEVDRAFRRFDHTKDEEELDTFIDHLIERIFSNCERLNILVHKEPASRRHLAMQKVDQLKYDARHLKTAQENMRRKREEKRAHERNREELLHRTFRANDTSIDMDHMLAFHTKAQDANRNVDDLISHGGSILDSLREQKARLVRSQKQIFDILNQLGMSNTVMRLIEKRGSQDKYILFGGMVATCIIMILIVVYVY